MPQHAIGQACTDEQIALAWWKYSSWSTKVQKLWIINDWGILLEIIHTSISPDVLIRESVWTSGHWDIKKAATQHG